MSAPLAGRARLVSALTAASLLLAGCQPGPVPPPTGDPGPDRPPAAPLPSPPAEEPGETASATGLDPLHPEDRFTRLESRALAGWTLSLWRRAADGVGFGDLATLEGPGPSPPAILDAVEIDPLSGADLDGDGRPEAIVRSWSGGAHCCASIQAFRLGPRSAEPILQTPPSNCPGLFEDLDRDGRMELVTCDDGFAYAFCAFADSPLPRVVLAYAAEQGAYVPATPDYAPLLGPVDLPAAPADPSGAAAARARCAALAPALEALYAGRSEEGWRAIETMPAELAGPGLRARIEPILEASPYYLAPHRPPAPILQPATDGRH